MPANLRSLFDRPSLSWLNTQLFDESPKNIRMVRGRINGDIHWEFSRQNVEGKWAFNHPDGAVIGQQEASAVANTLAGVKAQGFVKEDKPKRTD